MKLTKKQQQFIKDAYNSSEVCQGWKDRIKEAFPKLFTDTELVVGKWYISDNNNCIAFFKGEGVKTYGISMDWWVVSENWFNKDNIHKLNFRLATKEEVETALIEEAKRRGFDRKGITINDVDGHKNYCHSNHGQSLDWLNNRLWMKCGAVFRDGKWAEIIETITKKDAEKKLGCIILD